jgi:transposase
MPGPISKDLRIRIVDAYLNKEGSYVKLARRFSVARNSVIRWVTQYETTNSVAPKPRPGREPKILQSEWPMLEAVVSEKSDRSIKELAEVWNSRYRTSVHRSSMSRALIRAGITLKKRPSALLKGTGRM